MKKWILGLLTSAMLFSTGSVFADEVAPETTAPTLLYNNGVIGDGQISPIERDGRTMLPFRAFLEGIGATVSYDEANEIVTATKNDITVKFSLNDTYIDITKGEKTERIQADVPNILENDRVLVPVRFLSQAFDMDIGWDDSNYTAFIVDIPAYVKKLEEQAPNFKRYMELASTMPQDYTQVDNITFDYQMSNDTKNNVLFDLSMDTSRNQDAYQSDVVANVDSELLKLIANTNVTSIKDLKFSLMYKDGQFYAKTNLVEKLKEVIPDNEQLKKVSALVNENTWFKADVSELLKEMGLDEKMADVLKMSMNSKVTDSTLSDIFRAMLATNLTSTEQAIMVDSVFDMYSVMFANMFTINDLGNNQYEVKMNLTKDDLVKMVNAAQETELTKEDLAELEGMTFDLTGTVLIQDNVPVSSDVNFTMNMKNEYTDFQMKMTGNSKLTKDTKKAIVAPEAAIDLMTILKLLQ